MDSDEDMSTYGGKRPCKRWTKEQDNKLIFLVNRYRSNWREISQIMGKQAKSCRERWVNQLDPIINKTPFSL